MKTTAFIVGLFLSCSCQDNTIIADTEITLQEEELISFQLDSIKSVNLVQNEGYPYLSKHTYYTYNNQNQLIKEETVTNGDVHTIYEYHWRDDFLTDVIWITNLKDTGLHMTQWLEGGYVRRELLGPGEIHLHSIKVTHNFRELDSTWLLGYDNEWQLRSTITWIDKNVERVDFQFEIESEKGSFGKPGSIFYYFDDKINPFIGIPVDWKNTGLSDRNFVLNSKNNVIETGLDNFIFEYNVHGLPVTKTRLADSNGKNHIRWEYFYTIH